MILACGRSEEPDRLEGPRLNDFEVTSFDEDGNGTFERYEVRLQGELRLRMRDGNQDGHLDEWLFFQFGNEHLLGRDKNYDGRPDIYRLWLDANSGFQASDKDNDGVAETKDEFYMKRDH